MNISFFKNDIDPGVRKAIWQYLIDHSKLQKNGYWGIMFYIRDEDDFWLRVESRYLGNFKRYDELEKVNMQKDLWTAVKIKQRIDRHRSKIILDIENGNNIIKKLALFTYKLTRDYLFK